MNKVTPLSRFDHRKAQNLACGEDYCFICKRATDHWGEHSDEQIAAWARTPLGMRLMEGC